MLRKFKSFGAIMMAFSFFAAITLSSCSGSESTADEAEDTTEQVEEEATEEESEHPEHPTEEADTTAIQQ